MKAGGSALPCATPSSAPIPSSRIFASSRTSHSSPCAAAMLRAASATLAGRQLVRRLVDEFAREVLRLADNAASLGGRIGNRPGNA